MTLLEKVDTYLAQIETTTSLSKAQMEARLARQLVASEIKAKPTTKSSKK